MSENEEKTTQQNGETQPAEQPKNDKVEKKKQKRDSAVATKESFCAVFALFSALVLLILCTKNLIFGDIGGYVHELFMGTFGYGSYLLMGIVCYNCVAGFFGFRLFKKRAPVVLTIVTVVLAALFVQSLTTWNMPQNTYLAECFHAGALFPNTPPLGFLGALPIALLRLVMNQVGTAMVLCALTLVFAAILLLPILSKKVKNRKADKPEQQAGQSAQQPEQQAQPMPQQYQPYAQQPYGRPYAPQPQMQGQPPVYAQPQQPTGYEQPVVQPAPQPMQPTMTEQPQQPTAVEQPQAQGQPMPGYQQGGVAPQSMGGYYAPYSSAYGMRQRPGVSLPNDGEQPTQQSQPAQQPFVQQQPQSRVFSPFGATGVGQGEAPRQITPEESRRILFSGTPQQNYRDNLIFDSSSRANNRPAVEGQSVPPTYSQSYAQSVDSGGRVRPTMVAQDSQGATFGAYTQPTAQVPERQAPAQEVPPVQPQRGGEDSFGGRGGYVDETAFRAPQQPAQESPRGVVDRGATERIVPAEAATTETPQTPVESVDGGRFGRRDYIDVFSLSNPNVFGTEQTPQQPTDTVSDSGRRGVDYNDRSSIFDDDPLPQTPQRGEDPYSLRTFDDMPARGVDSTADAGSVGNDDNGDATPIGEAYDTTAGRRTAYEPVEEPPVEPPIVPPATERRVPQEPVVTPAKTQPEQPPKAPVPQKPRVKKPYVRVPLSYFDTSETLPDTNEDEVERIKDLIVATLADYKVLDATVASVTFGPTVTRYNVEIPRNVSPRRVVMLEQEIAMCLCCKGVNIYPSYEDGAVSIEVPNRKRQFVQLGCMFTDEGFINAKPTSLTFTMGKDVANRKVYGDICKMTHLLVAGSSGSGKSVFLGSLIISLITKYSPDEMRLILIDPKKTEFVLYNNLPHLMINEIITDVHKSVQSLSWAIGEMNRRYSLFEKKSLSGTYVVNIDEYNAHLEKGEEKLPKIVIIVDELADLMLAAKKEIEDRIQNLTQKARAAGIHLILATQRPSADVITGVIKGNLSTRIAFTVASDVDSRVILDLSGAQKLLGYGDMLYTTPGINTPVRVQSPFISSSDSQKVVDFIKANNEAFYDEAATAYINNARVGGAVTDADEPVNGDVEPVYIQALKLVIQSGSASISMLQRKCGVGFNKAGKIIEWMEAMEYISPFEGAKARKVLITKEDFEAIYGEF